MKDIFDILREAEGRHGQRMALATLVRARGSSYRRPGARMLICADGHCAGSLSGGCLEEEVAMHARDVLNEGHSHKIVFDTRRRFGCNGEIEIFIEPLPDQLLAELAAHFSARQPCQIATAHGDGCVKKGSRIVLRECCETDDDMFVHSVHPPIRVWIVGDGPDSKPIRHFCETLGWESFEVPSAESLPDSADEWTATIVKTHNYGKDFVALHRLLPLNLRYLGLIGPRQRRDQILHNLLEAGISINAGFFAPAGLDLDAETPQEIALAIVSEIQRVFGRGTGESLRERKVPIHLQKARSTVEAALKWQASVP